MITNYPTLKIKTHLNLILQMFYDLPLDLRKEINDKFISGAKFCFINKALGRLS